MSSELSDEIRRLPENIKRTELALKTEQKKLEKLYSIEALTVRSETLKVDIPKKKGNLKETEERLSSAMGDDDALQISIAEPKASIDLANTMLGDMSVLDELLKDVARMRQELNTLKSSLPQGSTTMTMDEAQEKKSALSAENKQNNQEITTLEDKYDQNSKMLNNLREKRNKLKDEQIKLQEDAHALPQMKVRQQELTQQIQKHSAELRQMELKKEPLNRQLTELLERKKRIKEENKNILNTAAEKLNDIRYSETDLKK